MPNWDPAGGFPASQSNTGSAQLDDSFFLVIHRAVSSSHQVLPEFLCLNVRSAIHGELGYFHQAAPGHICHPLMSLGAAQTSSGRLCLNPAGFRNTIKLGKCKTGNVSLSHFRCDATAWKPRLLIELLRPEIRLESKNHHLLGAVTHHDEGSDLPVVLGGAGNTQPSLDPSAWGKSLTDPHTSPPVTSGWVKSQNIFGDLDLGLLHTEPAVEHLCCRGGTGGSSFVPDWEKRFVLDFLLPPGNLLVLAFF